MENQTANSIYKQVETTSKIEAFRKGNESTPVATLTDGSGICHIINDDHSYLIMLADKDGIYQPYPYIFKEVIEVLKTLQSPDLHLSSNV